MEHQSAVTYGNGFSIYNGVRSSSWAMYGVIDPLIIHETGHEWFVNNPINNYNISVQIGHYVAVQDTFIKDSTIHNINHYVLDYNKDVAKNYFQQAKEVIRFYEKYFGDYQWWEDGYKLVEAPYLGMEHQSAVTYGNGFSIYNLSLIHI